MTNDLGQTAYVEAVKDGKILCPKCKKPTGFLDGGFDLYVQNQMDKAVEKHNAAVKTGEYKGRLFYIPVADGCAWYVVTKALKTRFWVEWRGFHPDRWHHSLLGGGGSFNKDTLMMHIPQTKYVKGKFGWEVKT